MTQSPCENRTYLLSRGPVRYGVRFGGSTPEVPPMLTNHNALVARCVGCAACRLRLARRNPAVYQGTVPAPLMLIGDAPSAEDDAKGVAFVGPQGQFLTRLLQRAGVPLDAVYWTHVTKCHPPQQRDPTPAEVASCRPHLEAQMSLVKPRRIVALGRVAAAAVTGTRGTIRAFLAYDGACDWAPEIPVITTHHPADLLRWLDDPAHRVEVEDTVARLKRAWTEAQT